MNQVPLQSVQNFLGFRDQSSNGFRLFHYRDDKNIGKKKAYSKIGNGRSKGGSINSSEPGINNYWSGSAVWRSVAILN